MLQMITYKFRKLFEESGKSLREIAKDVGVSHVTLARLAQAKSSNDYNVGADVLDKLSKYFECKNINELIELKQ